MSARVRRTASRYAGVSDAYGTWWAPVLEVLAERLLADTPAFRRALDIGCGVGSISRRLAERGTVVGLDATESMLARAPREIDRIVADAERIPLRDRSVEHVACTFMLQHVPSPSRIFREVRRTLIDGGTFATLTWGPDAAEAGGPYAVAEDVLDRYGVGDEQAPIPTWHARVDSARKMRRIARAAGFASARAIEERGAYRWTPETFAGWAMSMGQYGRRVATLDPETRNRAREDLERGLASLAAADMVWRPELVYCVASA